MLTTLERGVKGGKWFSLIDKVYSPANLMAAFEAVRRNKGAAGVDRQTIHMFERHLSENLEHLHETLRSDRYETRPVRRVEIPKPGSRETRPLGIPTVRDRVVQGAVRQVIEPIFENEFSVNSFGFRPDRGCKDALRVVERLLPDHRWVVDADLKSFFDTIPHEQLLARVAERVSDGRVLALIRAFLEQEVMAEMESWTPDRGTPQGGVISPLLANIYLDRFDHAIERAGFRMVRYADDFVILCRSREEAEAALSLVVEWVARLGLQLHPTKTRLVNMDERGGFDFLGYHFEGATRWPRKKSLAKLKDSLRGPTRRANGMSLEEIIARVNRTLIGWFAYFKHSHYTTFRPLDGWLRMRLRSILRRRTKRKGRGRGFDHNRWPNAFFAEHGLFSLKDAHAEACQSARR
jgi:RNA-directed DNA polymerase